MKTRLQFFYFILFISCLSGSLFPQADTASGKLYVVIKNDGTEYIGKILSKDAREVLMETKTIGQVIIPKHEIKEIREIKEGEINYQGVYVPKEVFSTRYFITTNGLPIEKGEHYVQWNLYGPDFQFGVGKNFGVGIMTTWLGVPVIGNFKYSMQLAEKIHFGLGGLVGTGSWALPDFGLALPFGALTFGDRKMNINISGGYGAVLNKGNFEGRALTSLAGMIRIGKRVSLVFDSFIMPPGAMKEKSRDIFDNNGENIIGTEYYSEREAAIAIIIPGVRWQSEPNKAFQFGFTGLYINDTFMSFPVPMVQWYRKL